MAEAIRSDEIQALMAQLERAAETGADGPSGFTARELCRAMACSQNRVQQHLRQWIDDGLIEFVGKRHTRRIDGSASMSPVYRLARRAAQERG